MASFPIIQVTEGQQRSLRLWDVLGVKFPEFFTKHPALLADYISNFETRPDDVFVVSYPKSGSCIFIVILRQDQRKVHVWDSLPLPCKASSPPSRESVWTGAP